MGKYDLTTNEFVQLSFSSCNLVDSSFFSEWESDSNLTGFKCDLIDLIGLKEVYDEKMTYSKKSYFFDIKIDVYF